MSDLSPLRNKRTSANAYGFVNSHLVVPQFFAFKLFKEIGQGNFAGEPRGFIGAEAPSFEQHAHRVAPANNSPSPRRRMG